MSSKLKVSLWFALSFVLSLGSYLALHFTNDWKTGYGPLSAGLAAMAYLVVCTILYFCFKGKNIWLARGFIWGLLAIIVFLFTLGGCGFMLSL